ATLLTSMLLLAIRGVPENSRIDVIAHSLLFISVLGLSGVAFLSGQSQSLASWFFVGVPLFAAWQLGVRAAILWAIVSAVNVVIIDVSEIYWPLEHEFTPGFVDLMTSRLVLMLIVLGFAIASQLAMTSSIRIVEQ